MASLDNCLMAHRVMPGNESHPCDGQIACEREVSGQFGERLDFRRHHHPFPLDALGTAAASAAIARSFAFAFALNLVLAEALAQILGRLAVRPAAAEDENVPEAAPQHGRVLFAVGALKLR